MTVYVSPFRIRVYHGVYRRGQVRSLASSMRKHGWRGRPVLGEALPSGDVQAWTASHRVPAARRARLRVVPVTLVDRNAVAKAIGTKAGEASLVHRLPIEWYDDDRKTFLDRAGDAIGAAALATEIETNAMERRRARFRSGRRAR